MRFLILSQYFDPEVGAAQVRLAAFVRQLARSGHRVEVVTGIPNYPQGTILEGYRGVFYKREQWEGIPVHRLWLYPALGAGVRRILNYVSFTFTCLIGLARAERPDYLFVESPPLFLGLPGLIAARLWRVPWIFNVADLWPDSVAELQVVKARWIVRLAYVLERYLYHRATYICAVTWAIREQLRLEKGVPESKLLFLPNGVDPEVFKPLPPDVSLTSALGLEGKQIVIFPGTHGYAHRVESVLRTAEVMRQDNRVHFLLIGSGSAKPELIAAVTRLKLKNVTFLDPVPPDQIPRFISIALCGLVTLRDMPLLRDARPVKALAIMGCGKPVVLAAGRGAGSFVAEARAGFVVSADDPTEIAARIRYLATHPDRASALGRNAREYVCRNLQWSTVVHEWLHQLSVPHAI